MAGKGKETVGVPFLGDTPFAAAMLVLLALGFLFAVERGFRGINVKVS